MWDLLGILLDIIFALGRGKSREERRRSKNRLKNVRIGDSVVYEYPGTGMLEKKEIVRLTPAGAIVKTYTRLKNAELISGAEELIKLDADIENLYGVTENDIKIESVRVANKDITCKTLIRTKEGVTIKVYVAPDVVPVRGLVKIEKGGEVLMRLVEYKYGQDIEKEKIID